MGIEEFYALIEGDFEGVSGRLRDNDRILKYIGFFADDQTFSELSTALDNNNWADAFRASHTLKGLAANLGFSALEQASHYLTEALRAQTEPTEDISGLVSDVTEAYLKIIDNRP